jgi:hypothetical protein
MKDRVQFGLLLAALTGAASLGFAAGTNPPPLVRPMPIVSPALLRDSFVEKPLDQLSSREVSDWGKAALAIQSAKWKHGESPHFIVHFFRNGSKIGRRSEDFYTEIKEFFGNRPDLLGAQKSQVFAFHETPDWDKFKAEIQMQWPAGVTRGNEFFYLSASDEGKFDSKGRVQAHEMTHLIFNRFFKGQPPLWLNEGIAEYFGLRRTSSATDFRRQLGAMKGEQWSDLQRLFSVTEYPANGASVNAFYAESAMVVDFLTKTSDRRLLLPKFVDAVLGGQDSAKALPIYGYKSLAEFNDAYKKYRKHF